MLYKHENRAILRFWKSPFFALVFDCGLGKTLTAVLIAIMKRKPVIVIAPNNICEQWEKEIRAGAGKNEEVWIHDMKRENRDPAGYAEAFDAFLRGGEDL